MTIGLSGARFVRPGQHVFGLRALPAQPRVTDLGRKPAVGRQHAGHEQLGDRLDDARPTDTGRQDRPLLQPRRLLRRAPSLVARSSRRFWILSALSSSWWFGIPFIVPLVAADHLEAAFERLGVDAHPLDRARRSAHAVADLCALEGRTGRAGGRDTARSVAEQDFAVGAHVDDQPDLVGGALSGSSARITADVVRADVPGFERQHVGLRARRQLAAPGRAP